MNNKILLWAVLITILGIAPGCSTYQLSELRKETSRSEHWTPKYKRKQIFIGMPFGGMDQAGDPDGYAEGFEVGCRNALAIIGASTYRLNNAKFDSYRMTNDPWYLRGMQDATSFCTFNLDWETH